MKVNDLRLENFKNIDKLNIKFNNEKPLVITGKNGSGKTSVIEGLIYAITGESPLNIVKYGETESVVTAVLNDTYDVERKVNRSNKKTVMIMGRPVTITAAKQTLENTLETNMNETEIILSSEVLKALKPNELATIFFKHDKRTINLDKIIELMEESPVTTKKKAVSIEDELAVDVKTNLKGLFKDSNVSLKDIEKAYSDAKSQKSVAAAEYKVLSVKSQHYKDIIRPEFNIEDLKKQYDELIAKENNIKAYKNLLNTYNRAKENKEKQDKMIIDLKLELLSLPKNAPDEKEYENINKKIESYNQIINENKSIKMTLDKNRQNIERTIDAINKPVCPISKKLICSTDKSVVKNDLLQDLKDIDSSIQIINKQIMNSTKSLNELKENKKKFETEKLRYQKRESLQKQLDSLLKNEIKLPEKPEEIKITTDIETEKKKINMTIKAINDFDETEKFYKEALKAKHKEKVYDYIMEALDTKGIVVSAFLNDTIKIIQERIKERAKLFHPNLEVKIENMEGIKPYFKFPGKNSSFQTYYSLSTGQKIIATLLMTDILNQYCGSEMLILDELNDLDEENFNLLMNFITNEEILSEYNNIIVCMVDHKKLMADLKKYDVDILKM